MAFTGIPARILTKAWPTSCKITDPKMIATKAKPRPGFAVFKDVASVNHTKASRK